MIVGDLVAKYGIDTSALKRGNTQMKNSMKKFRGETNKSKSLVGKYSKLLGAAGLAGAAVSAALAFKKVVDITKDFNKQIVNQANEVKNLADRLGISSQSMQTFIYQGERFGVKSGAITDGIKEMQMRADEFAETAAGPAAEAFERLGLSRETVQRNKNNTEEMYKIITDRFRDIKDVAARQRIADEIFGGQAAEQMTEMLGASREEIESMGREARETGAIMSESLIRAAEKQRAINKEIKAQYEGIKNQIALGFVEGFNQARQALLSFVKKYKDDFVTMGKYAGDVVNQIGGFFKNTFGKESGIIYWSIKQTRLWLKGLKELSEQIFPGATQKRAKELRKEMERTRESMDNKLSNLKSQQAASKILFGLGSKNVEKTKEDIEAQKQKLFILQKQYNALQAQKAASDSEDTTRKKVEFEAVSFQSPKAAENAKKIQEAYSNMNRLNPFKKATPYIKQYSVEFEKVGKMQQSYIDGWRQYYDSVRTNSKLASDIFADSMKSMSEELTNFVTTGEMSFKNLIASMERQLIQSSIDEAMNKIFSPGGGAVSGLFGGGGNNVTVTQNIGNLGSGDTARNASLFGAATKTGIGNLLGGV